MILTAIVAFSLPECFLSEGARERGTRVENAESRREAHTHGFEPSVRRRLLFIEWRSVKLKKRQRGLINDILNTRRGR